MNFTIFIFLGIIVFGLTWLATKFLGKIGLFALISLFAMINCCLGSLGCSIFTANVYVNIIAYVPAIFALFLIYKNYGVNDLIKAIIVYLSSIITYSLIFFTVYLYMGYAFSNVFNITIVPILISLLSMFILLVVAFLLKEVKFFNKFNDSFKCFLILGTAFFADCLINTIISEAGLFTFGQILLDVLMTFLFEIIILGILFVFEKLAININDNSTFDEKIKSSVVKTYNKAKSVKITKKDNQETKEEKKKQTKEKPKEIIVEDNKE